MCYHNIMEVCIMLEKKLHGFVIQNKIKFCIIVLPSENFER